MGIFDVIRDYLDSVGVNLKAGFAAFWVTIIFPVFLLIYKNKKWLDFLTHYSTFY